ncbi:SDR family NAD(P)-dependent oxidoreductase [Mycobacterium sp. pUA109]|uniref:SDR family NAD(P)-dependent oxidoreductase n=1 Tax=Mycobacterium sp. pUA109 TaxID=3238982 RepID=UPI00351B0FA7
MTARMKGKVAIVTGAGRGIGEAMARALAAEGASVVVADISGDQESVAKSIGGAAVGFNVDVTSSASVAAMVKFAVERFGGLHVLCNNAGIDGDIAPTAAYSPENFDRVIAVNLRGVFLGMHHAIPAMLQSGGGSIINTASIAAVKSPPGIVGYCAAKAGVIGLTKGAASDHSRGGIRVNAILPGVIETPMYLQLVDTNPAMHDIITAEANRAAIGRTGKAEEVAAAVVFLASDESSFLTGLALPVDGGYAI